MGSAQSKGKKGVSRFRSAKPNASSIPALEAINSQVPGQHNYTTRPSSPKNQQGIVNSTTRGTRALVNASVVMGAPNIPHEAALRIGAPSSTSVPIETPEASTQSPEASTQVPQASTQAPEAVTQALSPPPNPPALALTPPQRKDTVTAKKGINLWQVAREKLPKERRERVFKDESCDQNLVQALINRVERKKDDIDDKRWYYEKEDGSKVFYMESALEQLQKYAGIGDIAIQHNPDVVALAWAGFRFLLNVASAHTENMKSIGESFSYLLRIICCCDIYERLYINESFKISEHLTNSIVDLYVSVLEYLLYAEGHLQKSTTEQVFNSFLAGSKSMLLEMQALERVVNDNAAVAAKEATDAGLTHQIKNSETLKCLLELMNTVQVPIMGMQSSVEKMLSIVKDQRRSEILMWLSKMPFNDHHNYFSKRRREGTGEWLLQHEKYGAWKMSEKSSIFWLRGGAGCGKSFLASRIVDHFREEAGNVHDRRYAVVHFYCHYTEDGRNDPESILRTIVKQMCLTMDEDSKALPNPLLKIYEQRERNGHSSGPLNVEESGDLIIDLCRGFKKVTLIIDALDECNTDTRRALFRALNRISLKSNSIKIFVTGRNSDDIQNTLIDHSSHYIDATDNSKDINHYIETEIERRSNHRELRNDEEPLLDGDVVSKQLKDYIKSTLQERANGMFMWVQFQIVAICKERTQGDIYKAIGSLPKDLDATYSRIIHGLKSQGESISTVAEKVLKWIYFAVKPSSPDTIIQSLAVKPNEAVPDLKPLEWTLKKVLAACQNLVIFDETLKILRFAHFSVQEYLQRQPEFSEETGHAYMADICLTLLTYDSEGINGCQLPELERYAVKYWGSHARLSGLSTVDRCMELLNNPTVYRAWCHRAAPEDEELRATLSNGGPPTPTPTPFWVACYYGLPHVLERLDQSQVNAENLGGKTPLIAASWQQHEVIVRMLLDIDGVDVNKANRRGSPMSWVARNGNQDILKMLLAVEGVDVNKSDQYGMTPLSLATQHGHEKIVATLLAVDRVNVNKANPTNETPLSWAAHRGHKKIVAMLLAVDGVDVNAGTTAGETPLIRAVYPGYEKIVAMLLAADGVNVNAKSKTGRTPLWVAANTGREKILTMLLAVDGVNVNAKNEDGHTALSRALTNGYQEIARLLRAAGASETGDA